MISRDIDLVGNTESLKTCKIKLIPVRCHESDGIDLDLHIVAGCCITACCVENVLS